MMTEKLVSQLLPAILFSFKKKSIYRRENQRQSYISSYRLLVPLPQSFSLAAVVCCKLIIFLFCFFFFFFFVPNELKSIKYLLKTPTIVACSTFVQSSTHRRFQVMMSHSRRSSMHLPIQSVCYLFFVAYSLSDRIVLHRLFCRQWLQYDDRITCRCVKKATIYQVNVYRLKYTF